MSLMQTSFGVVAARGHCFLHLLNVPAALLPLKILPQRIRSILLALMEQHGEGIGAR